VSRILVGICYDKQISKDRLSRKSELPARSTDGRSKVVKNDKDG